MQQPKKVEKQLTQQNQINSVFSDVTKAPFDPIVGIILAFFKDPSEEKINLSVGAYRDQNGMPYVFNVVKKIEHQIVHHLNKEYLIDGLASLCSGARKIIFGKENPVLLEQRIATCQSLSGTGALSLGFGFISNYLPRKVYISNPGWPNLKNIIENCKLRYEEYPYYNTQLKKFDFQKMINSLELGDEGSIVALQTSGHNPTGCDPTQSQWKQICELMKRKSMIPFFDSAYQGFATGNLQKDAWPIRYFLDQGFQMFVAQSFAKNTGLYGQRIGAVHVVTKDKQSVSNILSRLNAFARMTYSTPPSHGAFLVDRILNNEQNLKAWTIELEQVVAARIIKMRKVLRDELQRIQTPGTWNHITEQIGMFTYTGLTQKQCELLMQKYHIYLMKTGRISLAGVNEQNVKRIALCIKSAIQETSQ